MFHYLIVLLLVNSIFHSLGAPTSKNEINGTVLANAISVLAHTCENSFISSQIKSKLDDCTMPRFNKEKQFLCLIFYDINRQLCDALSTSKLTLKDKDEDYTTKINEVQDVNILCRISKDWYFTNITEYPNYKDTAEKVFNRPSLCVRICGSDEIISEDTNYYCKYFKWGKEMLNQQVATIEINTNKSVVRPPVPLDALVSNDKTPETSILSSNGNETDTQTHNSAEQVMKSEPTEGKTTTLAKNEEPLKVVEDNLLVIQTTTNEQSEALVSTGNAEKSENLSKDIKVGKAEEQPQIVPNVVPSSNHVNKASSEDKPMNKEEVTNEDKLFPNQIGEQKESAIENNQDADEEYQDSEDGKDMQSVNQGGDSGDDQMLDKYDNKPDTEQNKNSKKSESLMSFNGGVPPREYYPNTIPDGYSTDDDHFFSFFLTAVIMVVLLYILYHNKNKVSKVFFGLIVEGRQPGRRRNSRGHAYRRLDTLEQAMSTKTAAPPSKIIY